MKKTGIAFCALIAGNLLGALATMPGAVAQTRTPTEVISNAPTGSETPRDAANAPDAVANRKESAEYQRALQNPQFRAERMAKECGPVTDAKLHDQCVASFGSSASPSPPTVNSGR